MTALLLAIRQAAPDLLAIPDSELLLRLAVWRRRQAIIGKICPAIDPVQEKSAAETALKLNNDVHDCKSIC